ncbi:hypothetical protein CANINC_000181 [Pichia inconspicua]|uniref:Zn(2)-C6 fungal-type domain-containing protein n=1 Tax=Pichia inconspicua TaxID=52247 RepID=A0A4T0X6U9_9ASCO|nr:hypothetical protein CANINC_000181 [[Candida] inconspicua]
MSLSPLSDSDTSIPPKKHLKSCMRCRKHKIKCNYLETCPDPCTSCQKRQTECKVQPIVPVRRSNIIKNLSAEVNRLKTVVDVLIKREERLKNMCSESGIQLNGLLEIENYHLNYSIDSLIYSSNEIERILKEFETLPFFYKFEVSTSLYESKPILFWTVVFMVTSDVSLYTTLLKRLHGTNNLNDHHEAIILLAQHPNSVLEDTYSLLSKLESKDRAFLALKSLYSFRLGKDSQIVPANPTLQTFAKLIEIIPYSPQEKIIIKLHNLISSLPSDINSIFYKIPIEFASLIASQISPSTLSTLFPLLLRFSDKTIMNLLVNSSNIKEPLISTSMPDLIEHFQCSK